MAIFLRTGFSSPFIRRPPLLRTLCSAADSSKWDTGWRQADDLKEKVARANRLLAGLKQALDRKPVLHKNDVKPFALAVSDIVRGYSHAARFGHFQLPPVDVADIQASVNSFALSHTKPQFCDDICNILRLAQMEKSLDPSQVIEALYVNIDSFIRHLGEAELQHLTAALCLYTEDKKAMAIVRTLAKHSRPLLLKMPLKTRLLVMKRFAECRIYPARGDIEVLCADMNRAGVSNIETSVLGRFLSLLHESKLAAHCEINIAQEIVARAASATNSLLSPELFFTSLDVARQSRQLTKEVLQTVLEEFLPRASPHHCFKIVRLLFFADHSAVGEEVVMLAATTLASNLDLLNAGELCILVRYLGKWSKFEDHRLLRAILYRVSQAKVSTLNVVYLFYGLAMVKFRHDAASKQLILDFAKNNSIDPEALKPALAVTFSIALAHYNFRYLPWLQQLDCYLEKHVRSVGSYSQKGLSQVLSMYGHLSYPIPSSVCRQLPDTVSARRTEQAVYVLWSLWRSGCDVKIYNILKRFFQLEDPAVLDVVIGQRLTNFYQQLTSGETDYNRSLPKFQLDTLVGIASHSQSSIVLRLPWSEAYQSTIVSALGQQQVLLNAMSEGGNLCHLALLQDKDEGLLPWKTEYISYHNNVPVISRARLPDGVLPVGVRLVRKTTHSINADEDSPVMGQEAGALQALEAEGWRAIPITANMAHRGPDDLWQKLKATQRNPEESDS